MLWSKEIIWNVSTVLMAVDSDKGRKEGVKMKLLNCTKISNFVWFLTILILCGVLNIAPMTLAAGNQYMEGNNPIELDVEISEDMVKGQTDEAMEYLRGLGPKAEEAYGDITAHLQGMLQ